MSNIENIPNLSEFFSELSKEKKRAHEEIKERVADPTTGLSNLFLQLEEALQDTKKVSVEEDLDNTKLSDEDHNKLDNLSNLLNSLSSDKQIPIKDEPEEIIPEEIIPEELVVESEEPQDITEPQDEIIASVIRNLDDMRGKTQVKEEVDQISSIRKEFDNFRSLIAKQIASSQMSGAGSGETRLEFLDDVDRDTAKSDGKALVYDSTSGKWKGESVLTAAITGLDIDGGTDIGAALVDADLFIVDDGAGGTNRKSTLSRLKTYIGAGAADDLGAGDAAVTLTTTSGNITIDAAANNSDIIFKGTDGGSDITMLTLDGSADGAAIFKSTVTATGIIIGSTAVTSTAAELNILDGVTSTAAELNAVDGITAVVGELNALDLGSTAIGTAIASKAVILDSSKDYTGIRNLTATTHIGALTGNADTATALATARTIGGTSFDGSANIAVALSATTTALATARTIGGTSFDGTANIAVALAATATTLATARNIGGVSFDGSANINLPGVNAAGNQNTSGTAAIATTVTITDNESTNESNALIFTAGGDVDGGNLGLESDGTLTYNPSTGKVTATGFVGTLTGEVTGNAATATALATARTIGGTSFDGTGNIAVALAATSTALATARTIGGTSFDGSANIAVALATLATTVTITDNESTNESNAIIFTAGGDIDGGDLGLESDGTLTYNPSTGKVTATGFVGTLTGNVTGNLSGNVTGNTSGTAATVTTAAQTNITSLGTLTALQVDNININGNAITSTAGTDLTITPVGGQQIVLDGAIVIDAGVVTGATSITSTAFVGDITGDVTGNADTATTLATARTIGGTSFDGSANIAVALATLATTATVSDSTANTNFPVVFNNESNALLDDTGALRYNPSTGTLLVPNLVVAGTTTQVDTVTMEAANAIVFEGATADDHETTLTIIDPTADRTQRLLNQSGYIPLLAAVTTTAITSTPEELNILDGATVVVGEINALDIGSTAVGTAVASKAVILDSSKDYTGIRNLTISGEIDAATGDYSGAVDVAGATTTAAITASGIIKTDDTTAATSTTDGSLQTDGGLSVAADAVIGDDLFMLSDAAVITFGADKDVTLTHVADTGILLNSTMKLQFSDASQFIHAPSATVLDLAATDEIELTATLVDVVGNFAASGTGAIAGAITGAAITASGILKTDDTTAATSTTDGSLQTDGGLSVAADAVIGDDLFMLSDAAVLTFGADKDVTVTHVADAGIMINAAMQLRFRDSAISIGSPADGDLDINADDEIELNSTLIDVNGNVEISGTLAQADTVTMATNKKIQFRDTAIHISSTADGDLSIAADDEIDITSTLIDINGNIDVSGTALITGVATHGDDVVSDTDSTDDLGTTGVRWANLFVDAITATDQITATGFTGTLDGILGSGAAAAATTTTLASTTITASGIVKTDDTTAATSTTDGSLQTDGGLSVVLDAVIGDDLIMLSDAAAIHFGANSEITATHVHNVGLNLKHTATADDKPIILTLQTGETDMAANDVMGKIAFQAPDEGTGTDAVLVAAAIQARAEGDFSSSSNATSIDFMTGASEAAATKMTLNSAGLLGIGIAPAARLHIKQAANGTANGIRFERSDSTAHSVMYMGGDDDLYIQNQANGDINWYTNTAAAMTLKADGKLGIGTTGPSQKLTVNGAASRIYLTGNSEDIDMDGSANGHLSLDGSGYAFGIALNATGANLYTNSASRAVIFGTDETERMRIDGSGNMHLANGGSGVANGYLFNATGFLQHARPSGAAQSMTGFYNGGSIVGEIRTSTTATAYLTSSDYRLKEEVVLMTNALAKVAQLKPCTYKWKSNGEAAQGFIAHELQEVVPEAVAGVKDELDEDGKPKYQGVDPSFLVATLTAAIQEQQATIEALTTRITALEG